LDADKTFIQKIEGMGSSTWTKATSRDCSYKYEGNLNFWDSLYIHAAGKTSVRIDPYTEKGVEIILEVLPQGELRHRL
jgi:hypothetical protein